MRQVSLWVNQNGFDDDDDGAMDCIAPTISVSTNQRVRALQMLAEYQHDYMVARATEAAVHALSTSASMHMDKMQQIIFNLRNNPTLCKHGANIVYLSNVEMAKGTVVEDIERETKEQRMRFDQILQEKYDKVNRVSCRTALRCRRCGSGDVTCEQKQTRGADESMTVFCTCSKCNNRWTMR